ncbi:MAG: acyltransferase family protein [Desulfobacterales bacterium]|nr:acyltransferase family protein [Desulfobacterales bacterium]
MKKRLIFFDNLRNFMIIAVIFGHATGAYQTFADWWFVLDKNKSFIFDIIGLTMEIFIIPIIYFISGYFIVPSLLKHGSGKFLQSRLKLFIIPWWVCVFFFNPIMPYLYCYTRLNCKNLGFFQYWLKYIGSFFDFHTGYIRGNNYFDHHHLWFISVLVVFIISTAIIYKFFPKIFAYNTKSNKGSMIIVLPLFGIITSIFMSVIGCFLPFSKFVIILNIIEFQPFGIPLYIGFFILGIYAYKNEWFIKKNLPFNYGIWLIPCLIMSMIYLGVLKTENQLLEVSISLNFARSFSKSFTSLCYLCFFISLFQSKFNSQSKINQKITQNSFDMYIVHMPVVVIIQFYLSFFNLPILLKFFIVFISATFISYILSPNMRRNIYGYQ